MVRLEGEKIILRGVDFSDIDTLLLWENSRNEPLYGIFEEQYSRHDVEQFVRFQQQYPIEQTEQLRLMICSYNGERLGCVDLTEYDGHKAFVSILIYDLDNRCKCFAKSALGLLIDYSKSIGLRSLYATILPDNTPSIHLFESVGFVGDSSGLYHLQLR